MSCFLDQHRVCTAACMAFDAGGAHSRCRLLNTEERLLRAMIPKSRPVAPAPKVRP